MSLYNKMKVYSIDTLNEGKDWTWKIYSISDVSFIVEFRIFYLNALGSMGKEPSTSINMIRKHVFKTLEFKNFTENLRFQFVQVDEMWRECKLTFTLRGGSE